MSNGMPTNAVSVDGSVNDMREMKEFDAKFSEKLQKAIVHIGTTVGGNPHGPLKRTDDALDEITSDMDLWTEALNLMVREWLLEKSNERRKLFIALMERLAQQSAQSILGDPRLQQTRPMWTSGSTQMDVKTDDPAWKNWLGSILGGK